MFRIQVESGSQSLKPTQRMVWQVSILLEPNQGKLQLSNLWTLKKQVHQIDVCHNVLIYNEYWNISKKTFLAVWTVNCELCLYVRFIMTCKCHSIGFVFSNQFSFWYDCTCYNSVCIYYLSPGTFPSTLFISEHK